MAMEGREEYLKARKAGMREYRKALLTGKSPYPDVLDDILKDVDVLAEVPVGLAEVPLSMVAGTRTAGRTTAFANNFMPILRENTEFAWKWSTLYESQMEEGIHDPIKAYEFMNKIYVLEGNKRVSVSKYCGLTSIMADITRVLPKRSDTRENKLYYEFLEFFKVAPLYTLLFSQEGFYQKFAEVMGQNLVDPWPDTVLENIRATFAVFDKLYRSKGGDKLGATSADAYLIYLTFYGIDTLLEDKEDVITSRIARLWDEFLAETNDDVKLVETPEEIEKSAGILDVFKGGPKYSLDNPLRVAFLYYNNPEVSSWTYGHELGRNHIISYFDGLVDAIRFDDCNTEEAMRAAIDAAATDEDEIIFTTSPVMMPTALRSAIHYPKMSFLNCSVNLSTSAVRSYYCKMYEAKYIMGALAASIAEDHKIGFLADYPIYGGIANINAFAIGAAMVDPKVKIYLHWSSSKDTNWKEAFEKDGVKLISGPDLIKPNSPSREYGLYRIEDDGKITNLAVPVWNWGKYYERIIRNVLEGKWEARTQSSKGQALNYWWGIESGVIDVILSDHIGYASRRLVKTLRECIIHQTVKPFDGEIHAQSGLIHKEEDPSMTNDQIIKMNWLCENVIGEIPNVAELNQSAQETLKMVGVE